MMRKETIIFWILMVWSLPAQAEFPTHLGGFALGEDISGYKELVQMETCREMARTPYLFEGEIIPGQGFRSGFVIYGMCDRPNKILRISLKFSDSSRRFFNQLLDRYRERFGPPGEYKGDPFQTLVAWKWSFARLEGERISLILQHNTRVEEEKKGTVVKMTLTSQMEKEKACHERKKPASEQGLPLFRPKLTQEEMWKQFVPY